MEKRGFGGDKKLPMNSLLARCEKRFIDGNVQRFFNWIEGYHLQNAKIHPEDRHGGKEINLRKDRGRI